MKYGKVEKDEMIMSIRKAQNKGTNFPLPHHEAYFNVMA